VPYAGSVLAFSFWIQSLIAAGLFVVIAFLGLAVLRAIARGGRRERFDPEDVADLDVFFVCNDCGTEFQVTRLGEIQVPRHCGEPMKVVRRPRHEPSNG
jgi:hypothetical protein